MAPSQHLNQCSHWWGFVAFTWEHIHAALATILYYEFENYTFETTTTSPRDQRVTGKGCIRRLWKFLRNTHPGMAKVGVRTASLMAVCGLPQGVLLSVIIAKLRLHLGLYSLPGKTCHCKILENLEAMRFVLIWSLWNLAITAAVLLPTCLSNFRAIRSLWIHISHIQDFMRFDIINLMINSSRLSDTYMCQ